jgi:membrane-associated phospholipid phosphatase
MRRALLFIAFAICTAAPTAWAQGEPDRDGVNWRPKRGMQVGTGDWVITGAAVGVALGAAVVSPLPQHARGGVLIDEDARDFLRARARNTRYGLRDASDVGVSLASTWPFLVDALLTTWWYRGDPKLARNMAIVSAETFAIVAAAQGVTNNLVSRERPYGRLCGEPGFPESSIECQGNVRYRSFFSGHASLSFASASVLCVNHLALGLLGPPWDALTCATGYTVATATALFRVVGDMHYVSDVTVGALVGTSIGLVVPMLHLTPSPSSAAKIDVRIAPVGQGLGLTGTF